MARVLLVTYFYPPDVSVGSHRWPPMARWLRRFGHEVTVLTTSAFGHLPDDHPWVVRTTDLQGPGALRKLLRRPSAPRTGGGAAEPGAPAPALVADGIVPDAHAVTWVPFTIPAARRLVRERRIDCVITNGPPDSVHLVGPALGRARPAWLVDLEDGWRFEQQRAGWPTRAQDRLDAALERRILSRADGIVSISTPIADDAAARFGRPRFVVRNGWDPEAEAEMAGATAPPLEDGVFNLVYTGALSHVTRRDPRALFDALRRLPPDLAARVRVVVAGGLTEQDRALLDGLEPALAALVRHVGALPRAEAVALQRRADALLLINTGPQRGMVTGKLFEYLAAGRPVLALSTPSEAGQIVRESGAGVVVPPEDPDALAAVLARAVDGGLPYAPSGMERYRFPAVARAMEAAIETTLARRRAA